MCGIVGTTGKVDLFSLESGAGQRHEGAFINLARKIWPRSLIRCVFPNAGLFMMIEATKIDETNSPIFKER
jgi:hypothetical protein